MKVPYGLEISKTGRLMLSKDYYESSRDIIDGEYAVLVSFNRVISAGNLGKIFIKNNKETHIKYELKLTDGRKLEIYDDDFVTIPEDMYVFISGYTKPEKITETYTFNEILKLRKKKELNKYLQNNEITLAQYKEIFNSKINFYSKDISKLFNNKNKWIETDDYSSTMMEYLNSEMDTSTTAVYFEYIRRTKNENAKQNIRNKILELLETANPNKVKWYNFMLSELSN